MIECIIEEWNARETEKEISRRLPAYLPTSIVYRWYIYIHLSPTGFSHGCAASCKNYL